MAKYTIRFGKSTSVNYDAAVEIASEFPSYKQTGEGRNILHEVTFEEEQLDLFFELYDLVGRWKSTSIYFNGERILHGRSNFLWCFRERQNAYDKDDYCFSRDDGSHHTDNYFGCRFIKPNPLEWKGLQGYGEMDRSGTFHVNKDRIQHELSIALKEYGSCPAFNYKRAISLMESIPEKINPNSNSEWEYVTDYTAEGEVATAVRLKNPRKSGPLLEDSTKHIEIDMTKELTASTKPTKKSNPMKPLGQSSGCGAFTLMGLIAMSLLVLLLI